jgi:hypothetical protein
MLLASLSAERRIEDRLAKLGCTAIFISVVAGTPPTRLNQALRGLKPLSNSDATLLLNLTERLASLRDALSPFPLGLSDPVAVRSLLDEMDEKSLKADDVKQAVSKLFKQ